MGHPPAQETMTNPPIRAVSKPRLSQEPLVRSYPPAVAVASRTAEFPVAGTLAGMVVVRASGLLARGGTAAPTGDGVPLAGELAVFCRPVESAPAVVRRDGTVLAGGWLPDFVRLGELERHLGDEAIEAIVGAELRKGRLRKRNGGC